MAGVGSAWECERTSQPARSDPMRRQKPRSSPPGGSAKVLSGLSQSHEIRWEVSVWVEAFRGSGRRGRARTIARSGQVRSQTATPSPGKRDPSTTATMARLPPSRESVSALLTHVALVARWLTYGAEPSPPPSSVANRCKRQGAPQDWRVTNRIGADQFVVEVGRKTPRPRVKGSERRIAGDLFRLNDPSQTPR